MSSFGITTASNLEARYYLIRKSNGNCAICGKPVNVYGFRCMDWNIDHVIPKAVVKWALDESYYTIVAAKSLLSCDTNLVVTHPTCNEGKGCACNESIILSLHINDEEKQKLLSLRESLSSVIESYERTKKTLLEKQNYKCSNCGCDIGDDSVLRRKITTFPRSLYNGRCLCVKCNDSLSDNTPLIWR